MASGCSGEAILHAHNLLTWVWNFFSINNEGASVGSILYDLFKIILSGTISALVAFFVVNQTNKKTKRRESETKRQKEMEKSKLIHFAVANLEYRLKKYDDQVISWLRGINKENAFLKIPVNIQMEFELKPVNEAGIEHFLSGEKSHCVQTYQNIYSTYNSLNENIDYVTNGLRDLYRKKGKELNRENLSVKDKELYDEVAFRAKEMLREMDVLLVDTKEFLDGFLKENQKRYPDYDFDYRVVAYPENT